MMQILRFLRVLVLGAWIGAIIFFAAVVTQAAFSVLPSQDEAGRLVGSALDGLHLMGLIAGAVFIVASLAMKKYVTVDASMICVSLMLALTVCSEVYVVSRMNVLRKQMGSVQSTTVDDPRRVEFDRLHGASVDLEGGVLLIGLIALFLAAREKRAESGA